MKQPARPMTVGLPLPPNAADVAAGLVVEWRPNYLCVEAWVVEPRADLCANDNGSWFVDMDRRIAEGVEPTQEKAKRAAVLALAGHIAKGFDVVGSAAGAEAAHADPAWLAKFRAAKAEQRETNAAVSAMLEAAVNMSRTDETIYCSLCVSCGAMDLYPHRPGCHFLRAGP